MSDNAQSIPNAAANLRDQSDALLKRCGWTQGTFTAPEWQAAQLWTGPAGEMVHASLRPHPYESIDAAVDLAEAMGLKVMEIQPTLDEQYRARLQHRVWPQSKGPTIAEAICAAIEEALGDPA